MLYQEHFSPCILPKLLPEIFPLALISQLCLFTSLSSLNNSNGLFGLENETYELNKKIREYFSDRKQLQPLWHFPLNLLLLLFFPCPSDCTIPGNLFEPALSFSVLQGILLMADKTGWRRTAVHSPSSGKHPLWASLVCLKFQGKLGESPGFLCSPLG